MMRITEIRIKLINGDPTRQRLRAFCSITFDNAFVVRDLKILEGNQGYFVAMPSRKLTFRCPICGQKNVVGSNFCFHCGMNLTDVDPYREMASSSLSKAYVDVVHPINSMARDAIHRAILRAYALEKERAREPDYVPTYDDYAFD